jgi:hypothetical protein
MPGPSGIRGVTIDDVANVANNGSSAMRGGYTFTRSTRAPRPTPVMSTNVQDLLSGLLSTPLNTAGKKYSGYPTASAEEAAVLGMLDPFYAMGDYAAQLADRDYRDIVSSIESPYGAGSLRNDKGYFTTYPNAPIAMPGADMGVAPARVAAGNELDPAYQAAELAKNQAWQAVRSQLMSGQPVDMTGVQQAQADLALASRNATSARLAQATGAAAQGAERFQTDVGPRMDYADEILSIPRYELARQIATQYFQMDPALAYGTFTPKLDLDYMKLVQDLKTQQNLARGIDPNATVADTLLANDPTGKTLQDYQDMMADQALLKLQEGANTAEEDAYDAKLEAELGVDLNTASGDLPRSTARWYLQQPDFVKTVNESITAMKDVGDLGLETPAEYIARVARSYVAQGGDPVAAVILQNILASFEFLPGEL